MGSPGAGRPSRWLWAVWLPSVVLGWVFAGVFAYGLYRDRGGRDVDMNVSLARDTVLEREATVLRTDPRELWLASLNHEPPFGAPFSGALHVRITDPAGAVVLDSLYTAAALAHERPDNMDWSRLAELAPARRGAWRVRVAVRGDPRFDGVRSSVILRPRSVGMEGLVTYAAIVPAVLLLALAGGLGLMIRSRGGPLWPAIAAGVPLVIGAIGVL